MFFKKMTSLILIALLAVMLAACGGKDNTPVKQSSEPPPASQTNSNEGKVEEVKTTGLTGDFEIQYFVGGYGDAWWKEVLDGFQKANPDLNIKQSAGANINEQMRPRWIQNDPPDVVFIDGAGSNERQMIDDDQLMDITDFLKASKNVDGDKLTDILISQATAYSEGKNYSLPLVFGSWGLFYDKALFQEKGWKAPSNWDEFVAVSEQISAAGMPSLIHTGIYPYYINGGLLDSAMVAANNGDGSILLKQAQLEEGSFSGEPVKKALSQIVQLVEKQWIDKGSVALNHTDSQAQWLQHKAAFIPNGLWLENEMKKDIPEGFQFGFIPSVAQGSGQNNIVIPYTNTIAIAKNSKNPEAAKAFIEFAFTKQNAVRWAEITGALMNVKADLSATSASEVVKDAMAYFNASTTTVAPVAILNGDVEKVKQDATVALTSGKITADEWMQRLESAAKKAR